MNQNLLTYAQMAFERNDLFEASQLFRLHVTHYPDISAGWLGLFQSTDQHAERIECLEQMLRIAQAETRAADAIVKAQNTPAEETFESIDSELASDFELIKPYEAATPEETAFNNTHAQETPAAIPAKKAPRRPATPGEITMLVERMTKAGNQLVFIARGEVDQAVRAVKEKVIAHPYVTTQFSTSYGRKLRRVPSQQMQKLPKVLSWIL